MEDNMEKQTQEQLKTFSLVVQKKVNNLVITEENFNDSLLLSKEIKELLKSVDDLFDASIKAAKTTVKTLIDQKRKFSDPLNEVEQALKSKQKKYYHDLEEKEKIRKEKLEKELRSKQEEDQLRKAIEAEKAGNQEKVKEILNIQPAKIEVKIDMPKVDMRSFKKTWKIRITDASQVPTKYLIPDEKLILKDVKDCDGNITIPGVEIYFI